MPGAVGEIAAEIATLASPEVVAASSTALLVIVCAMAWSGSRLGAGARARHFALSFLGALLSGALVWAFFASVTWREQNAQKRALALRAQLLSGQATRPGSPLGCVNAPAGNAVEATCEATLFSSAANVASAVSYVAEEFSLLAEITAYARRSGADLDRTLDPLRSALEADRYGFLAKVLAARDGCTADHCPALKLLPDPSDVRMNLFARTFHHFIERYRQAWAKPAGADTGALAAAQPASGPKKKRPKGRELGVNFGYPTAASIPAISIMAPEPKETARPRAAATDAPQTQPVWSPAPAHPSKQ